MNYIVFDMEWNQTMGNCRALPDGRLLTGEIIEIGAVRLDSEFRIEGTFKVIVKPVFYRKMHRKVRELTGIDNERLSGEGVPFKQAYEAFLAFCGGDFATVTWGECDVPVLKENLTAHGLGRWEHKNYDLQIIYASEISGAAKSTALDTAAQLLGIVSDEPYHDALNDALVTAKICSRLDMKHGIEGYSGGAFSLSTIDHIAFETVTGITDIQNMKRHPRVKYTLCPECKRPLVANRLIPYGSNKKLARIACPDHGDFLLAVRTSHERDATWRAMKYVYEWTDDTKAYYEARLAVADRKKAVFLDRVRNGKGKKE